MAKKSEVKTKTVKTASPVTRRANYGSAENRRSCHKCQSTESNVQSVRKVGRLIQRYRVCSKCGARRSTQEVVE